MAFIYLFIFLNDQNCVVYAEEKLKNEKILFHNDTRRKKKRNFVLPFQKLYIILIE